MSKYLSIILLITFLISGTVHARLYAQKDGCNSSMGKVLNVENDELFTIESCGNVQTFEELSYCYGVNVGDTVMFEWNHENCDVVSFSVLRNGAQCGVRCP